MHSYPTHSAHTPCPWTAGHPARPTRKVDGLGRIPTNLKELPAESVCSVRLATGAVEGG
jgi:hypothetical protein